MIVHGSLNDTITELLLFSMCVYFYLTDFDLFICFYLLYLF